MRNHLWGMMLGWLLLSAVPSDAEVVRAGWVPNRLMPQGQVQLVRQTNGAAIVVLLDTRFLDRVVHAIIEKEQRNWPADHPDARAYIAGLLDARDAVRRETGGRGRESLMIAFVLDPADGRVEWSTGPVERDDRHLLAMPERRQLLVKRPSRTYLDRNAALILADSFGLADDAADALLGEAMP